MLLNVMGGITGRTLKYLSLTYDLIPDGKSLLLLYTPFLTPS